jgi:hypothetical protein
MYTVYMPDFSRRSIILGTAGVAAAGAGVTAAASGLSGSVEGQADVQAEQALTVTDIEVEDGDQDASFERVSDDNTSFQAAVELNNGDEVRFDAAIRNNAADDLDVQIEIDSPDVIDIAVGNEDGPTGGEGSDNDANVDDTNAEDDAIKTGEGTYIATISGSDADAEEVNIAAELDDTADPGSYDIGVAINPLSTDNN